MTFDRETAEAELQKKLDPAHIKPAPKGKFGDYIEGHHAISEANRIFGHFDWNYRITRLQLVSEQTVQLDGKNGPYEQYRVGYLCTVIAVVDGVEREGSAVGSGVGSPLTIADHHESAIKEAETDALKRALRTFGNPFGLALYDKTKANVGKPEKTPQEKFEWFKEVIECKTDTSKILIDEFWNSREFRAHFDAFSPEYQAKLQAIYDARKSEIEAERKAA